MDLSNVLNTKSKKGKRKQSDDIPTVRKQQDDGPPTPPRIFQRKTSIKDPVREHNFEEELQKLMEEIIMEEASKPKKSKEETINPDTHTRIELGRKPSPTFPRPPYVVPLTKKQIRERLERRLQEEQDRNFCRWDHLSMPRPPEAISVIRTVDVPSPDVSISRVNVVPRRPSASPSQGMPDSPFPSQLELRKPKSGVFINETEPAPVNIQVDSFDLVLQKKVRQKRPPQKDEKREEKELLKQLLKAQTDKEADEEAKQKKDEKVEHKSLEEELLEESKRMAAEQEGIEEEGDEMDEILTKMFRRKVSQISKATSLNSKELTELPYYDDYDLETEPQLTRIVQKFRRDSEAQRYKAPLRKIKRGTLESHSFTKLEQPTIKQLCFGQVMGNIHQGNEHFGEGTRDIQGICMPIAAYCYSMLVHPDEWTDLIVDDILDIGNKLMLDSLVKLHMHKEKKELEYTELSKYCYVEDKKLRFQVYEPEIVGLTRSADRKIYNLTKGLKLFFNRHRAGILRTVNSHVVIWKDKHYYFFDGKGRKKNMEPSDEGKAGLAYFYDIPDICTVLLKKSNIGNWPYTISKLSVLRILDKNAPEEDDAREVQRERSDYNVVDNNRAVVQGSFDLGDLCFDFSRNKQAIAMAAVCLVYSRITPPSAWHRKTVDKIMIIGNQLYLELVRSEQVVQMSLDNLPASFTVGPYLVEIVVYTNLYADLMFKKGQSMFQKYLEKFLETNSMAIVFVGKYTLAVWKQRNLFYCFDPYSRNQEGLKCRNGVGCVSMNTNLETLTDLVARNFDNPDDIFYLHAMKVLKIHRDPAQAEFYPKTVTMDDIPPEAFKNTKMRKSKRKATHKAVTADFEQTAIKTLLAGDFLGNSLIEIGSGVESLAPDQLPPMMQKFPSRAILRAFLPDVEKPIDLDSPSLSDTQIEPDRPEPIKGDEAIDMSAWELTQDELELQGGGEGEEGQGEEAMQSYMAANKYAQVHAGSLESYKSRISAQVNTDITVGFLPIPRNTLEPTNIYWKQKAKLQMMLSKKRKELQMAGELTEPAVTQSQELAKPSNFTRLPDNSEIIRGGGNIAAFGQDLEYIAPFVCMMASAIAQKYAIVSWSPEIIDYTLRSGARLYKVSKIRYDQVPILEVPKVTLGKSNYSILVEYLFDGYARQKILEVAIDKILFRKHFSGILVTPSYACAVFFKNHLYYMFDCFGCNEVGLGEGPTNEGVACMFRFKNIRDLTARILYNKSKRDSVEEYDFTRFVLSSCTSKLIPRPPEKVPKKDKKSKGPLLVEYGEGEIPPEKTIEVEEEEKPPQPKNKVGYQFNGTDRTLTLQGSTALKGRLSIDYDQLKVDHFVSICAILMMLCVPVLRWDTKRVDYVINQGKYIYTHAENLEISEKRIIRNILIHKHFFDIIVTRIKIPDYNKNRNLEIGLDTVLRKRNYVLVQFPNASYVLYQHNGYYHLFDPYPSLPDDGSIDEEEKGNAGWTLFTDLPSAKNRIKSQIIQDAEHYIFYTFEVTSVRRAPRKMVLSQRLMEYEMDEPTKPEIMGKAFNEKIEWLKKETVPWSRMRIHNAKGRERGRKENLWHSWDVEYPGDLYSLVGTIHQTSEVFDESIRGKQTLANLVVAIGMLDIYELSEWTPAILDSILTNGAEYFKESIKTIKGEDHELEVGDLSTDCTVFPYHFEVIFTPIVEGTMFVMRSNQYNLYKGLRYFLDGYENRSGVVYCTKVDEDEVADNVGGEKRVVAFGKVREKEYFMYDCQALGPPMFLERQGVGYVLRCRTLKRLVHVLTLTLRGGDFYIYEVDVDNFQPVKDEKDEEK